MKKYELNNQNQLVLIEKGDSNSHPAKRVNIVILKLVKESSPQYKERSVRSPEEGYILLK